MNGTYDIAFDIIPVRIQSRRGKRDDAKTDGAGRGGEGFHGLFKRPLDVLRPLPKPSPKTYKDYIEPFKGVPKKGFM